MSNTFQGDKNPAPGTYKLQSTYDACAIIEGFDGEEHTEEEDIAAFQLLIDLGNVWSMQGLYGRTAMALIESGHCMMPANEVH